MTRVCGSLHVHGTVRPSLSGRRPGLRLKLSESAVPVLSPRRDPTYCSAASPYGFPPASRGVQSSGAGHVGAAQAPAPGEAESRPAVRPAAAGGSPGAGRREQRDAGSQQPVRAPRPGLPAPAPHGPLRRFLRGRGRGSAGGRRTGPASLGLARSPRRTPARPRVL